jgi:hypothetical protein
MAVSTLDGVIEEAVVKRSFRGVTQFERISVRRTDGQVQTLRKRVAVDEVAAELKPGTRGRLYLFKALDLNGIHGLRDDKGQARFGFSTGYERAMLICTGTGVVAIVVSFLLRTWLTYWAIICLIIGIPGYLLYHSTRMAATRQFEADAGDRPATGG